MSREKSHLNSELIAAVTADYSPSPRCLIRDCVNRGGFANRDENFIHKILRRFRLFDRAGDGRG